jgi:hypothetical protein
MDRGENKVKEGVKAKLKRNKNTYITSSSSTQETHFSSLKYSRDMKSAA